MKPSIWNPNFHCCSSFQVTVFTALFNTSLPALNYDCIHSASSQTFLHSLHSYTTINSWNPSCNNLISFTDSKILLLPKRSFTIRGEADKLERASNKNVGAADMVESWNSRNLDVETLEQSERTVTVTNRVSERWQWRTERRSWFLSVNKSLFDSLRMFPRDLRRETMMRNWK